MTVIFKKMLLTGAMTIVASGSSAQLVIALLIVLINLLLVLKLGPFVDSTDDWLVFLTSMQMLLTLLGGLLTMTDNKDDPTYDSTFMGVTMILVNSFGLFALLISLLMLHPKIRKRCNKTENEQEEDVNLEKKKTSTKVTPIKAVRKQSGNNKKNRTAYEEEEDQALINWGGMSASTSPRVVSQHSKDMTRKELLAIKKSYGPQSVEYKTALQEMGKKRKRTLNGRNNK